MSIIQKHEQYESNSAKWLRCRDVVEGQDSIHAREETYLAKLDKQTDAQYAAYKSRARFFNASDVTVNGMQGLVSRKDPVIVPEENDFEEDVSRQGISLSEYSLNVLKEMLIVGRCGTLIDYPIVNEDLTKAQAEAQNLGPVWAFYICENIYNWSFEYVNNVYQATRVMLFDGVTIINSTEKIYRYRELVLVEGVYSQNLYEAKDPEAEPVLKENIIPKINGKSLDYIPFFFHTANNKPGVDKPPLIDLFDTNIKHYQLKADHAHALHYIALPTPYVTGITDEDSAPTTIGPQKIWALPNESSQVGMLEFSGAGVEAIKQELSSIELHMAQLGSRILAPEDNVEETATATRIKSMSENSKLAKIVKAVSLQITRAWRISLEWLQQEEEEMYVTLNTDFFPKVLSGNDLISLVTGWQSNAYSKETLFQNLKEGEIVDEKTTFEEEEERIANNLPVGTGDLDNEQD